MAPPIGPLAGRTGPVALVRGPVGVVLAVRHIAVLVHGAVVVVVVVMVAAVLGPASIPLPFFGGKVARLSGGAKVCAQTWQRRVSMYENTQKQKAHDGLQTGEQWLQQLL